MASMHPGCTSLSPQQQDAFYQRVARAMKMDQTTVDMLSGDFAVDAIIARAEQLALREVSTCVCVCVVCVCERERESFKYICTNACPLMTTVDTRSQ